MHRTYVQSVMKLKKKAEIYKMQKAEPLGNRFQGKKQICQDVFEKRVYSTQAYVPLFNSPRVTTFLWK